MNTETMKKILPFLLPLFTLFLLFLPQTSFADREGEITPVKQKFHIAVFPDPPQNGRPMDITILGDGYGPFVAEIYESTNFITSIKFTSSEGKILSSGENALVDTLIVNTPARTPTSSWSVIVRTKAAATKFDISKTYTITVLTAVTGVREIKGQKTFKATDASSGVNTEGKSICTLDSNGVCKEVNTSLGKINPDPLALISTVLRYLMGISGGLFLLIFIRAGYRLITSQGNPESIKEARESITSAIVGFLFLLFAFIVLEIIGVDIFQIPGFAA